MAYIRTPDGNSDYTGHMEETAVSTQAQGIDGYGMDAQRVAIAKYTPAVEFNAKKKIRPGFPPGRIFFLALMGPLSPAGPEPDLPKTSMFSRPAAEW